MSLASSSMYTNFKLLEKTGTKITVDAKANLKKLSEMEKQIDYLTSQLQVARKENALLRKQLSRASKGKPEVELARLPKELFRKLDGDILIYDAHRILPIYEELDVYSKQSYTRARNFLNNSGLSTVADLVAHNGFESFFFKRNFGKKTRFLLEASMNHYGLKFLGKPTT